MSKYSLPQSILYFCLILLTANCSFADFYSTELLDPRRLSSYETLEKRMEQQYAYLSKDYFMTETLGYSDKLASERIRLYTEGKRFWDLARDLKDLKSQLNTELELVLNREIATKDKADFLSEKIENDYDQLEANYPQYIERVNHYWTRYINEVLLPIYGAVSGTLRSRKDEIKQLKTARMAPDEAEAFILGRKEYYDMHDDALSKLNKSFETIKSALETVAQCEDPGIEPEAIQKLFHDYEKTTWISLENKYLELKKSYRPYYKQKNHH